MNDVVATRREQIRQRKEEIERERQQILEEGRRIEADLELLRMEQEASQVDKSRKGLAYAQELEQQKCVVIATVQCTCLWCFLFYIHVYMCVYSCFCVCLCMRVFVLVCVCACVLSMWSTMRKGIVWRWFALSTVIQSSPIMVIRLVFLYVFAVTFNDSKPKDWVPNVLHTMLHGVD